MAIINRGKLVKIGTLEELLHAGRTVVTLAVPKEGLADTLMPMAERVSIDGEHLRVYVETEENVHKVIETARGSATLVSVVPQRQTLEDLFVEIVREVRK